MRRDRSVAAGRSLRAARLAAVACAPKTVRRRRRRRGDAAVSRTSSSRRHPPGSARRRRSSGTRPAGSWLQAGDLRAAERNFTAALKQSPAFYPAEAGLGYVALARQEAQGAALRTSTARWSPTRATRRRSPAAARRCSRSGERARGAAELRGGAAGRPVARPALRSRIEVLRFRGLQQDDRARRARLAEAARCDEARAALPARRSRRRRRARSSIASWRRSSGGPASSTPRSAHARQAVALDPDEPRTLVLLGEIYEAQGDCRRALRTTSTAAARSSRTRR